LVGIYHRFKALFDKEGNLIEDGAENALWHAPEGSELTASTPTLHGYGTCNARTLDTDVIYIPDPTAVLI
jgi:hypothetical protein